MGKIINRIVYNDDDDLDKDETDLVEQKNSSEKKSRKRLKNSKIKTNNISNKIPKARKFFVDIMG
jgi:hypothetical protein